MLAAPPALTIRGRYARLNAGSWVVLGIGLLLLAAAVKFLVVPGESHVAHYPALGALPFLAVFALQLLRRGRFLLTATELRGRRVLGGSFCLRLDQVREVRATERNGRLGMKLTAADGGRVHLPELRPESAVGWAWLLAHLVGRVPLEGIRRRQVAQVRPAKRTFVDTGHRDEGFVWPGGGRPIYLPETTASKGETLAAVTELIVGVGIHQRLRLLEGAPPELLPLRELVAAMEASGGDLPRIASAIAEVCAGTVLEGAGPCYDGATAGHPVRVEVDGG